MDTPLDTHFDKPAFYRWLDAQEGGHYELENGKIIMVKVSRGHARIASNFIFALRSRLDADQWNVLAAEFAVEIGEQVRFPDVLVEPASADIKALETTTAKVLVEVLSPGSEGRDFVLKLGEYTSLPTVDTYIIASQDEPICWLWERGANGTFPARPIEVAWRKAEIRIMSLDISLPLAELYRGIGSR